MWYSVDHPLERYPQVFAPLQACFIDLIITDLFYYLNVNQFLKISACYISLERDFIAEYSAINLYHVTSLESLDTAPLKPGTYQTTQVIDGSER